MFARVACFGRRRAAGLAFATAAIVMAGLILGLLPALAQGTPPVQRSYINPFPNGDRYRVVVLGDSLGDGSVVRPLSRLRGGQDPRIHPTREAQ